MTPPRVCVAGTFDGLHAGHLALLSRAFAMGEPVLIGLTSDAYVRTYKNAAIRPYGVREAALSAWANANGFAGRYKIVAIDDAYTPASTSQELATIVVSEESRSRAGEINQVRTVSGLPVLSIVVVPMVEAEDHVPISAHRIRRGEIDGSGRLILPDSLRGELAVPLGRVLDGEGLVASLSGMTDGKSTAIVSVGDLTTKTLLDAGVIPVLMIVDNKVNRMPYADLGPVFRKRGYPVVHVKSGPGYISAEAQGMIRKLLADPARQPTVLEVDGEEDLLVLSVISESPNGTVVYYGQPRMPSMSPGPVAEGIVETIVGSGLKARVGTLLARFTVRS